MGLEVGFFVGRFVGRFVGGGVGIGAFDVGCNVGELVGMPGITQVYPSAASEMSLLYPNLWR